MVTPPTVGVLALQGGVAEHLSMLEALGVLAVPLRRPSQLIGPDGPRVDALVLPGGESTTIDRLLRQFEMFAPLREIIESGIPTLGTCAGMILLARAIADPAPDQHSLGVLDITVARNAFGSQIASNEAGFQVEGVDGSGADGAVRGALIRAPEVRDVGTGARVISRVNGRILGVTSVPSSESSDAIPHSLGLITAVSFHPELSGDPALHRALVAQATGQTRAAGYAEHAASAAIGT